MSRKRRIYNGSAKLSISIKISIKNILILRKNKSILEAEIKNTLEKIETTNEGIMLIRQWKTQIKKGSKNDYITFYREVLQAVNEATVDADYDVNDGEQKFYASSYL